MKKQANLQRPLRRPTSPEYESAIDKTGRRFASLKKIAEMNSRNNGVVVNMNDYYMEQRNKKLNERKKQSEAASILHHYKGSASARAAANANSNNAKPTNGSGSASESGSIAIAKSKSLCSSD